MMKKQIRFCLILCLLAIASLGSNAQCLDWVAPQPGLGWTDFNTGFGGAPCDDGTGCPFFEITDFQVWASEAYLMDNAQEGGTYAFSMCNGPGAGSWVPEFTIIAPSGAVDAFGPGDGDGCTISWEASESGTYLIVVNEEGQCGINHDPPIDNGYPALTCVSGASCGGCTAGNLDTAGVFNLCAFETVEAINAPSEIPASGGQGLLFTNWQGGAGALGGNFILTGTADTNLLDLDLGGILSFNGFPPFVGTWVAYNAVYTNNADPLNSICSVSDDSLVINFSDLLLVEIDDNGDGTATAEPFVGLGNYEYLWSNGQTTQTATGLVIGETYDVVVTDEVGCSAENSVIIDGTVDLDTCLTWVAPSPTGGWIDFNNSFGGAPCDDGTGCPFNEIQAFQVWAAEAYQVDNFIAGGTYAFSMCNGSGAGSWAPEFTIIAPSGTVDAAGPGDGDGCTITWTASESGTYLIVVNEAGECGGGNNQNTDNGFPALTCLSGASCAPIACSAGGLSSTGEISVCGPTSTFTITTDGNEDIPAAGGHGWFFSDALGGSGGLPGGFQFSGVPSSSTFDSDLNGVLSANGFDPLEGLWVIKSSAYTIAGNPDNTICDLSTDSLIVNFAATSPTVTATDNGDGSATASAAGGVAPYSYLWSNGQTTGTASDLATGEYTVVVSDANGCTDEASVGVVSGTVSIEGLRSLSVSPNPTDGAFMVALELSSIENVRLAVVDITGREVSVASDTFASGRFRLDLTQHPAGMYILKIAVGSGTLAKRLVLAK